MSSGAVSLLGSTASVAATVPAAKPQLEPAFMNLRGGSGAATAAAGLFAVSGAAFWTSPSAALQGYGLRTDDTSANLYMRQVAAWQIVAAASILAGRSGAKLAATRTLYASAICVLACVPVNEYFDRSKPEAMSGVLMLSTLGKLISMERVQLRGHRTRQCLEPHRTHHPHPDRALHRLVRASPRACCVFWAC